LRKALLLMAITLFVEGVASVAAQSIDERKGCARD
jgi:hypothetical protein